MEILRERQGVASDNFGVPTTIATRIMDFRSIQFVLFVNGIILCILAGAMIAPGILDFLHSNRDWQVFAASGGVTLFTGLMLAIANNGPPQRIDQRTSYLLTILSWSLVGAFGSLPLWLSSLKLSFTDAFFETMSGLTTTGSTVLTGLDTMAPGLLLWRSLLQWIGGIGIVVMAIVLLPLMRVGGMQLFKAESSDISGKIVPRVYQLAALTALTYLALSVACAIAYSFAGMGWFDAVNHAMTTLATGGYSTKDASIGHYDSVPIEVVSIIFMTSGALPLVFYARLFLDGPAALARERQIVPFLCVLFVATGAMTLWNVGFNGMGWNTALRQSAFNITSILTDTGYATADFAKWGSFAIGLFFVLFLVGGCAGSTAGGIKIFRWQLLFQGARRQLLLTLSPHRVVAVRYAGRTVELEMLASVRNFFFLYLLTFLGLSLACMATGLDFLSSTSGVAQGMANAGPGLSTLVGPAANFASIPNGAKWIIVLAMLMGRLELMTVYVLLLRDFWRR